MREKRRSKSGQDTHTHTHADTHAQTHTHRHTYRHTQTHTHTGTDTATRTHTVEVWLSKALVAIECDRTHSKHQASRNACNNNNALVLKPLRPGSCRHRQTMQARCERAKCIACGRKARQNGESKRVNEAHSKRQVGWVTHLAVPGRGPHAWRCTPCRSHQQPATL